MSCLSLGCQEGRGRLFDCFLVASFTPLERQQQQQQQQPQQQQQQPPPLEWEARVTDYVPRTVESSLSNVFALIPHFCFPDCEEPKKVHPSGSRGSNPHFFPFVLTDGGGEHIYVSCVTRWRMLTPNVAEPFSTFRVPVAMCLLSSKPYFDVGFKLLVSLCRLTSVVPADKTLLPSLVSRSRSSSSSTTTTTTTTTSARSGPRFQSVNTNKVDIGTLLERFLAGVVEGVPAPLAGESVSIDVFGDSVDWQRVDYCTDMPHVDDHVLLVLVRRLPATAIVDVVEALLLERQVVVHSRFRNELVPCCEAFLSLLWPFCWQHTYVPCLPAVLLDYLEAPFPYLMGILTAGILEYPAGQGSILNDAVLVDLNRGVVTLPANEQQSASKPQRLPEIIRSQLIADLERIIPGPTQGPSIRERLTVSLSRRMLRPPSGNPKTATATGRAPNAPFCMPTWRDLHSTPRGGGGHDPGEGGECSSASLDTGWLDMVRVAFARMWASREHSGMLTMYKRFLRDGEIGTPPSNPATSGASTPVESSTTKRFDAAEFLKVLPADFTPFLRDLVRTQVFKQFIADAHEWFINGASAESIMSDIALFDLFASAHSDEHIVATISRKKPPASQKSAVVTHKCGMPASAWPRECDSIEEFPPLPGSRRGPVAARGGEAGGTAAEASPRLSRTDSCPRMKRRDCSSYRRRFSMAHSSADLLMDAALASGNGRWSLSRLLRPGSDEADWVGLGMGAAAEKAAEENASEPAPRPRMVSAPEMNSAMTARGRSASITRSTFTL